ncbi:MAG: CpXC domain-containing protein [Caldimonas sp.]
MSQFSIATVICPACSAAVSFDLVQSVNADRMPTLRDEIVARTFQSKPCPTCGTEFRVRPEFNYVEHGRNLWIAALPLERLPHWNEEEAAAEARFERVYGPRSSPFIQAIGKRLVCRLAFGWAAVREKLVIADLGLDDVSVELCKSAVLRASASAPVGLGAEMRLLGADETHLGFAWLRSLDESVLQSMRVGRALYDEIAADDAGDWIPLREQLDGMFVDMGRLLVVPEETPASG